MYLTALLFGAYLANRQRFGASSEKRRKEDLPGQMSLFDELMEEEPAKEIEPEYIEIKAHERKRKKKK